MTKPLLILSILFFLCMVNGEEDLWPHWGCHNGSRLNEPDRYEGYPEGVLTGFHKECEEEYKNRAKEACVLWNLGVLERDMIRLKGEVLISGDLRTYMYDGMFTDGEPRRITDQIAKNIHSKCKRLNKPPRNLKQRQPFFDCVQKAGACPLSID